MQRIRVMGGTLAVLTLAILTTFQSAVVSSAEPVAEEVEDSGIELFIDDYADDGTLVGSTVQRYREVEGQWEQEVDGAWVNLPADDGDEPVIQPNDPGIGPLGSETIPAPSARTGCRTVWGRTWLGYPGIKFYHLENRVKFCYNKSTHKVSNGSTTWDILANDGLSDIPNPRSTIGYYTWDSGVSNSGYQSLRQWSVSRSFMGETNWYYPRVNLFAHGSGTVYVTWRTR